MLEITKKLVVDIIPGISDDLMSVLSLYWSKYYCSGAAYKYRIPLTGLEKGYDKTIAYASPFVSVFINDNASYYRSINDVLDNRSVTPSDLFNTILLIDSILPGIDECEWDSYVRYVSGFKSQVLHVEAYRLALCAKIGLDGVLQEIDDFVQSVDGMSIDEIQKNNAFYGKKTEAAEHEFSYFCLGVLYLSHYTSNKKCRTILRRLFENVHSLFIKRKKYLLDPSSHTNNAAYGLMSCFLLSFYILENDPRSLNAACYLLEHLDSGFKKGFGIPDAEFPSLSRIKASSWTLAYYIVAKCIYIMAVDKFEERLSS